MLWVNLILMFDEINTENINIDEKIEKIKKKKNLKKKKNY